MPDYQTMTAAEAIRHAKEISGLTAEEAAQRAGVSPAVMRRYLRSDDDYFPGLEVLPRLCRAYGNTALLRWLEAQIERAAQETPEPAQSRAQVLTAVARAAASLGDVQRCLADSEGRGITPAIAREVRSLLQDVVTDCHRAHGMLRQQAEHRDLKHAVPLASIRMEKDRRHSLFEKVLAFLWKRKGLNK